MRDTLTDGKSKFKEISKQQSDILNDFSNQFLLGSYFKNQFSKSVTTTQRSRASSKKFNMISSSANQMEHSQGRSLILCSRARGTICLKRCSNVEGSFNFLAILFPVRPLNQEDFPNVHSVIENLVSGKEIANLLLAERLKHFISNWQRIITEPVILHFARHCVKSVRIFPHSD